MTNQLKWRLGKMATPDEVLKLVQDKIITKEEARQILFSEESQTERDVKSLEDEIKFLRDLVEKLSQSRTNTIEIIKQVQVPYYNYNWYQPYQVWCGTTCGASGTSISGNYTTTGATSGTSYLSGTAGTTMNCAFTDISTF